MKKLVCIGGGEIPRYKNGILLPYETKICLLHIFIKIYKIMIKITKRVSKIVQYLILGIDS